jgi:predicted  nucleic acid-binding Zn-ribbon protein
VSGSGKRGDATLDRIANLADGWSVRAATDQTIDIELEDKSVESSQVVAVSPQNSDAPRPKPRTAPPPPPRAHRASDSPPVPSSATRPPPLPKRSAGDSKPPVISARKVGSGSGSNKVPVNEFGQSSPSRGSPADGPRPPAPAGSLDGSASKPSLGSLQSRVVASAASPAAVAAGFAPPTPVVNVGSRPRTDVTLVDPPTEDDTAITASSSEGLGGSLHGGSLRVIPKLPQRKGILGDLGYVFTALLGMSRLRRESSAIEIAQVKRLQLRKIKLLVLGKTATTDDAIELPAVLAARTKFAELEDRRSELAGQVAAAGVELEQVARDRASKTKQLAHDLITLDQQVAELTAKMAPIEREFAVAKKRAAEMRDTLQRLDDKIAATEATVVSVKTARQDRAAVSAEVATLKADRVAVARDEPVIAARLDELTPRMAGLEAERAAVNADIVGKKAADIDDSKRCDEVKAAIAARKIVLDRSLADSEDARDRLFVSLGDHLSVERPDEFVTDLIGLDALDVEIGTADRRLMELREMLSSVDRWKMIRGSVVLVIIVMAIVAAVLWFVQFA